MAATTIGGYSTELTQIAFPAYAPIKPNKSGGRVRIQYFTKTFAAEASGTSIALCIIPAGARILTGGIIASATLANSATIAMGLAGKDGNGFINKGGTTSDSTTMLKAAAALGATMTGFALTQALNFGLELDKECYLTMTTGTGAVTTEVVSGYLMYAVD